MADRKISRRLSQEDIHVLADRLLTRAASRMLKNQPALQADLRLAAAILHHLAALGLTGTAVEVTA